MSDVQVRVKRVEELLAEVKAHPMCAHFTDDGSHYWVNYPEGDFAVDAVRADYRASKSDALARMLDRMERDWKQSFPCPA